MIVTPKRKTKLRCCITVLIKVAFIGRLYSCWYNDTLFKRKSLSLVHSGGSLFGVLALVLSGGNGTTLGTAVQDLLPVLVHLELHDADL